ncbi:MAG: aminoacyl-tRNA hydrolase [Dehalococcoidales bacterium]
MKLIVGLGNPGRKYEKNRHNLGFMCLNHFARQQGIKFDKRQAGARTGSGEISGSQVILARPQTYMNQSGLAVSRLVAKFKVNLNDLLVIHDDLDLPTGKIRLRGGGGSGGHKGINSLATELGSQDFVRLRVGIGRPDNSTGVNEDDIIDYVLSDFTAEEKQIITGTLPRVSEAILCLLDEGLEAVMNKYN